VKAPYTKYLVRGAPLASTLRSVSCKNAAYFLSGFVSVQRGGTFFLKLSSSNIHTRARPAWMPSPLGSFGPNKHVNGSHNLSFQEVDHKLCKEPQELITFSNMCRLFSDPADLSSQPKINGKASLASIPQLVCLTVHHQPLQDLLHSRPDNFETELFVASTLFSEIGPTCVKISAINHTALAMVGSSVLLALAHINIGTGFLQILQPAPLKIWGARFQGLSVDVDIQ